MFLLFFRILFFQATNIWNLRKTANRFSVFLLYDQTGKSKKTIFMTVLCRIPQHAASGNDSTFLIPFLIFICYLCNNMKKIAGNIAEHALRLLSRLPLRLLYVLSDVCFPVVYYAVRYRRTVVRDNIDHAFPEWNLRERRRLERRFYRFFCDYTVETIKLITITPEEMKRRMVIEGTEEVERSLDSHPFVFLYLGHYCNWEWISSMPLWRSRPDVHFAQIYRPLKSPLFDRVFMQMRTRFGAENISKYDTLRRIVRMKKEGQRSVVGFISDQSPNGNSIHDWVPFFHRETPVFTGTERIGKKMDAAIYFADVRRLRRGYYHLRLRPVTDNIRSFEDYRLTEYYMEELERMIRRQPHLWLWSHKRWKHRREDFGNGR